MNNLISFYKKSKQSNQTFTETCFLNYYKYINSGDIEKDFLPFVVLIDESMSNYEFKNIINDNSMKYKYNSLGKLEIILIAIFYVFYKNDLITKTNKRLFINSILEISKKYISLYSYKIINGIIKNILSLDGK